MALQAQKKRKQFAQCDQSYRIFLKKFSEKPKFDRESVGAAWSYVYDTIHGKKWPFSWHSKYRLVNTVLLNEQKILDDLQIYERFPKCAIAPLASSTVSFRRVKKFANELLNDCDDCYEYSDKDLINRVCKQFKLSSSCENVRQIIKKLKVSRCLNFVIKKF